MLDRSPRIFLYGYYGFENLGDDLLVRAAVAGIRRHIPEARFHLRNLGPIQGLEDGGAISLSNIERIITEDGGKLVKLTRYLRASWRELDGCQWLVFGGGTVFHERPSAVSLFLIACLCGFARLRGIQVAAVGVGVDRLRSWFARKLLRFILASSAEFSVRDEASLVECRRSCTKAPVRLTADLAYVFASQLRKCAAGQMRMGTPTLAIAVSPASLPEGGNAEKIEVALGGAITQLLDRGWQVVLLPFQTSGSESVPNDLVWLQRLRRGLAPAQQKAVELRSILAEPTSIVSAFRGVSVYCGMRYHGHVIASIIGVPFVGIMHDQKVAEICGNFGMPVVPLSEISADSLVRAVSEALERTPDASLVDSCVVRAATSFDVFRDSA